MCEQMQSDQGNPSFGEVGSLEIITSLLKGLTLWPVFDWTEFKLWWGRMLRLILVLIRRGIWRYKIKGTVLVFSWCGSGFIMPQIKREQWKQKRLLLRASHHNKLLSVIKFRTEKCSIISLFQTSETTKTENLTAPFSFYRNLFI